MHVAALCCAEWVWGRGGGVEVTRPVAAVVGHAGSRMHGNACAARVGVPDVVGVTVVVGQAGWLFYI